MSKVSTFGRRRQIAGTARGPPPGLQTRVELAVRRVGGWAKGAATLQLHRCGFPHSSQPVRIQATAGPGGKPSVRSPYIHTQVCLNTWMCVTWPSVTLSLLFSTYYHKEIDILLAKTRCDPKGGESGVLTLSYHSPLSLPHQPHT